MGRYNLSNNTDQEKQLASSVHECQYLTEHWVLNIIE